MEYSTNNSAKGGNNTNNKNTSERIKTKNTQPDFSPVPNESKEILSNTPQSPQTEDSPAKSEGISIQTENNEIATQSESSIASKLGNLSENQILGLEDKQERESSDETETLQTLQNILEDSQNQNANHKPENEFSMQGSDDKGSGNLRRIIHIIISIIIGISLIFLTIYSASEKKDMQWGHLPNSIKSNKKTAITLVSNETFLVSHTQAIFGGERIKVREGRAEITFFDSSMIRMEEGAEIKIEQIQPFPIITHTAGDIWVYSQERSEIRYENATFYPRGTSAEFSRDNNKITVSAYRHPLFGKIWSLKNPEKTLMAVPPKREITFSIGGIPSTLPNLHFSKLKKELHLKSAEENQWVKENILFDNRLITSQYESATTHKKLHLEGNGIMTSLKEHLTFFPKKIQNNFQQEQEKRKSAFIDEYIFINNAYGITTKEAPDDVIDSSLYLANITPPDTRVIRNISHIITEAKKRNGMRDIDIHIAQTLLSLLEDSLKKREVTLADEVANEIVKNWESEKRTKENKKLLEIYREIIADLMRKNMNQITHTIFSAATNLDKLALQWEDEEEKKMITGLEIIERNLETAENFLQKSNFNRVEEVLGVNNLFLETKPNAKLFASYQILKDKQETLQTKNDIYREQGIMSEEKFQGLIAKKIEAENKIKQIHEAQLLFMEEQSVQQPEEIDPYDDMSLTERILEDFSQEKLIIISMLGDDDDKARTVEITEAKMPDGTIFQAEYLPVEKVIRNIEIRNEKLVIPDEILLADLNDAVRSIRKERALTKSSTLEEVTQQLQETWQITEEDPLAGIDPLVIDVTRRLTLAELANKGFSTTLPDISMLSENEVLIKKAHPNAFTSDAISFVLNTKTKNISHLQFLNIDKSIIGNSLEDLEDIVHEVYEEFTEEEEARKELRGLFTQSGIKGDSTDIPNKFKDIPMKMKGNMISFTDAFYKEWSISGLVDPKQKMFINISRDGLILAEDIPYHMLGSTLSSKWSIYSET